MALSDVRVHVASCLFAIKVTFPKDSIYVIRSKIQQP